MKKKNIVTGAIIIAIGILMIVIGIVVFNNDYSKRKFEYIKGGISEDGKASFVVYDTVEEVEEDETNYRNEHMVSVVNNEYTWVFIEKNNDSIKEYFFDVYSLETGKKVTYDLQKICKKHKKELPEEYELSDHINIYQDGTETCLSIEYKGDTVDNQEGYLMINIDTGKSFIKDDVPDEFFKGKSSSSQESHEAIVQEIWFGLASGTNLLELNSISLDFHRNRLQEGWIIEMSTENLPKENKTLYTMFPELEEVKGAEGKQVELNFEELDDDDLFELFLEDGQEISYEGCVIYAHSSVDGKEHVVNSKEEFDLYYEEVSYEQVLKNHAGETDELDDHLPPYVEIDGLESGKEYYTSRESGYRFFVSAWDDYSYNNEVVVVRVNGEEVDGSSAFYLPVSDEKQTVEITVSDTNGNSQTIVIKDVLVTYQEEKEEAEEKKKNFTPIVLGVAGGVALLAAGGIIIGLQIRKKKKQNG